MNKEIALNDFTRLYKDGNCWIVLVGKNLQEGTSYFAADGSIFGAVDNYLYNETNLWESSAVADLVPEIVTNLVTYISDKILEAEQVSSELERQGDISSSESKGESMKQLDTKTIAYIVKKIAEIYRNVDGCYRVDIEKKSEWIDLFSEEGQDSSVSGFKKEFVDQTQHGDDSFSGNVGYDLGNGYCLIARFDM